jgi:hypothetical protein
MAPARPSDDARPMTRTRNFTARTAALALAASLAVAAPAGAKGGAKPPPPDPTPAATYCTAEMYAQPNLVVNEAGGGGCVAVRIVGTALRLDSVILAPGWTYVVTANGESTASRVAVQFTETATGRKVDVRVEFGKTVIR